MWLSASIPVSICVLRKSILPRGSGSSGEQSPVSPFGSWPFSRPYVPATIVSPAVRQINAPSVWRIFQRLQPLILGSWDTPSDSNLNLPIFKQFRQSDLLIWSYFHFSNLSPISAASLVFPFAVVSPEQYTVLRFIFKSFCRATAVHTTPQPLFSSLVNICLELPSSNHVFRIWCF